MKMQRAEAVGNIRSEPAADERDEPFVLIDGGDWKPAACDYHPGQRRVIARRSV